MVFLLIMTTWAMLQSLGTWWLGDTPNYLMGSLGAVVLVDSRRIEDAFPLFMGLEAGEADAQGAFPPDSLYGRVAARLDAFDRILMDRERAAGL